MADLRPDARAIIRAGKTAFHPEAGDRKRVLASLTRTLGEGTLGPLRRSERPASGAGPSPLASWILGGAGALVLGAAVLVATHRSTTTPLRVATLVPPSAPSTFEPATSATVPSVNAEDLPVQAREESTPGPARPSAPPSRSPSDSLPEEVRLLSRAEQQLSAGHPGEALATLGEHERRFPGGALSEERLAARVQSLCALGRVSEAKADLEKLVRAYPGSAYYDRARRFCRIDTP